MFAIGIFIERSLLVIGHEKFSLFWSINLATLKLIYHNIAKYICVETEKRKQVEKIINTKLENEEKKKEEVEQKVNDNKVKLKEDATKKDGTIDEPMDSSENIEDCKAKKDKTEEIKGRFEAMYFALCTKSLIDLLLFALVSTLVPVKITLL